MLEITTNAELKKINPRAEAHGDAMVRAMDLRFVAIDVDGKHLDALIPHYKTLLYKNGEPVLQEVYPLKVRHKVLNATVKIKAGRKSISLVGCDIAKIKVTPRAHGHCDIDLTVQSCDFVDGYLDPLSRCIGEMVSLQIEERQMTIDDMDQAEA